MGLQLANGDWLHVLGEGTGTSSAGGSVIARKSLDGRFVVIGKLFGN